MERSILRFVKRRLARFADGEVKPLRFVAPELPSQASSAGIGNEPDKSRSVGLPREVEARVAVVLSPLH